jgi:RNA polymerase sigma-70 factor (ECF subfamily)
MASDDSKDALIRMAVAGDRTALAQLLYLHHRPLARLLSRQLRFSEKHLVNLEDVQQETYLRAFRDIHSFEGSDCPTFARWLSAIAIHRLQNAVKAARAQKRNGRWTQVNRTKLGLSSSLDDLAIQLSDHAESPSSAAARREAAAALQIGLASLPPDQRRAVELRYLDGKTESETAVEMSKTRGAVHGLVVRARVSMRQLMGRSSRWFFRK